MVCSSGQTERTEVDLDPPRQHDALLGGGAEQAGDARMGVLDVEDRVVGRLPGRHGEVEIERAVVPAGEEGEARGILPDLLDQLLHQHELAATLGHAHRLAVAEQGHELDDQRVEALGGCPRASMAAFMRWI